MEADGEGAVAPCNLLRIAAKGSGRCYIRGRSSLLTHLNFGGDLDSTGVLRSKLHARDAVGP